LGTFGTEAIEQARSARQDKADRNRVDRKFETDPSATPAGISCCSSEAGFSLYYATGLSV
jgi:hypothetical protein